MRLLLVGQVADDPPAPVALPAEHVETGLDRGGLGAAALKELKLEMPGVEPADIATAVMGAVEASD